MYPQIPIDRIDDSPFQTRLTYDTERVEDLAGSIESDGLMQPPIGRVVNGLGIVQAVDGSMVMQVLAQKPAFRVQLAFGHTRLRAFKHLGRDWMPVVVQPLSDEQMDTLAWSENKERSDLNTIEEATAIRDRIERNDWTHEQVGDALGLTRSAVSNKLRLLRLPTHVQEHVASGALSEGKARALVGPFEFWQGLGDEDQALVDWYRKRHQYGPDDRLRGEPEHLLNSAIQHGWSPDAITRSALGAEDIERWRGWRDGEAKRKAAEKEAKKQPDGKTPEQIKREKIQDARKKKVKKLEERLQNVLAEQLDDFTSAETGDRVLAALAIGHATKPAVAKAAKALGVDVEKGYGLDEHLAATAHLSMPQAVALALAAMMFKELDNAKDWDAPTPVYDAMMAGVATEAEAGARNEAVLRGEVSVETVLAEQATPASAEGTANERFVTAILNENYDVARHANVATLEKAVSEARGLSVKPDTIRTIERYLDDARVREGGEGVPA